MTETVEVTEWIAADPTTVYALVSDLPRMKDWSPENAGGRWLGGATGAVPGAKFKGHNVNGRRRWSTLATINEAVSDTRFAFTISVAGIKGALWTYELAADAERTGTVLTERWQDLRPRALLPLLGLATGVPDRAAFTRTSIESTLAGIKRAAEHAQTGSV